MLMKHGSSTVGGFSFGVTSSGGPFLQAYTRELWMGKSGLVKTGSIYHIALRLDETGKAAFFLDGFEVRPNSMTFVLSESFGAHTHPPLARAF